MRKFRFFTMCVACVVTLVAATAGLAVAADEQEAQWIALLESDAPKAEKAITCKRLAVFGTDAAVPALAKLLPDKELTSWARIALEAIPGAKADAALRDAAGRLEGRVLVGVINSIGVRRDAAAVEPLAKRLGDADTGVAQAAAVALGHIGNAAATKGLEAALAGGSADVRSAVAEGLVLCAEKLLAEEEWAEAARLYDKIRVADVSKQRVLEATRGAILARQTDGIPLLIEQLRSDDKALVGIGLSTARELPGTEVTEALVAELGKMSPNRQALLLLALADRNDPAALPAVLEAAANGPNSARIVAVDVLRRIGNVSCVPALLDVAAEADADLSQAAKQAIEGLPGEEVDLDLVARLSKAEGTSRRLLIELVGKRQIAAATATLLEAANDSDGSIRSAALAALGATVGLDDLPFLITRVAAPKHADDTEAAEQALRVACIRMPDGEACAKQLVDATATASVSTKSTFLEILGAMGNATALEALGTAAKDKSPKLQDTASRLLGEWMTIDAAPVLLDLAKTAPEPKFQIRSLRGYIRLVRQFTVPDSERVAMCRAAMEAAQRDAEKKLVLEVMGRYPSVDMLRLAVETAKIPSIEKQATGVSLAIAQKVGGKSVDVRELLSRIGQAPVKVEILKAEYGAGDKTRDVTGVLKKHVRRFPLIVLPSASYNAAFGGDPAPGVVKRLKIRYRIDGKEGDASFPENAMILLPAPG